MEDKRHFQLGCSRTRLMAGPGKPLCLTLRSENWQSKPGAFVSSAKSKIENDFPTCRLRIPWRGSSIISCNVSECSSCFTERRVSAEEISDSESWTLLKKQVHVFTGACFYTLLFFLLCFSSKTASFSIHLFQIWSSVCHDKAFNLFIWWFSIGSKRHCF